MESPPFLPPTWTDLDRFDATGGVRRTRKENPLGALTTLMTRHLATLFRRPRTRWQLPARRDAGYALRAAVTTVVLVTAGGLEHLVNELRLTWTRLRLLSRDEPGYTTTTLIMVALVVVIALAAFVVLWMTVISRAIHTRVPCHPGKPCG
jgi:hypothetical protein